MGDIIPQRFTKFDRFVHLLEIGVGIYEAKHKFPGKWAAAVERIDFWKYEGGNTFTLGSSPDTLAVMVSEYLAFIYEAGPEPYWLKVLEE